jgi:hypothetical protein
MCPVCGGTMDPHLRINAYFIQNESWHQANEAYQRFLSAAEEKKTVLLELGVGYNTPGIIRYPFEKWTHLNRNATLIRLNKNDPEGMKENESKTISITSEMQDALSAWIAGDE